ncbi:TRAP transporter permease [Thalassospira alkalitolerans]|uniref:TRAP transporter permease n=1 Tax=Thalassospira alkalitolerans TaxID=1293890 RepID=UPI003AA8135B
MPSVSADTGPSAAELEEIERKYDEGAATKAVGKGMAVFLRIVAVVFALYHYFTAGFGLPSDHWHMGWHLSGLFILIYAFYPAFKTRNAYDLKQSFWRIGNVSVLDILAMLLGISASLYLSLAWRGIAFFGIEEQTFRMGNPNVYDLIFGCIMIVLVLDLARRTLGWILPLIICVFMSYALLGPYFPGILQHPGVKFQTFVSSMYFPHEGIYGVTLWVTSTVVFHFVLFGTIAQRTGLGQLFIDNASILAGRYTGGPAKVSVISSAFFGTISGSSVANTVSTGSLTIPNMKRLGYPGHFAGGVEAAASAGGQITPPIMGAAAFIMAEFLNVPYTTIVLAGIFPALLHYFGVFSVVHLMARKLGLKGMAKETLPHFGKVWKSGWANILPLVGLLVVLFSGYTPYMSAFCGISLLLVVGMARRDVVPSLIIPAGFAAFVCWKSLSGEFGVGISITLLAATVLGIYNPQKRVTLAEMVTTFETGVKYALAVGAASAAVGIVVGVINTTGIGFRLGFMVTSGATEMADVIHALTEFGGYELFSTSSISLFLSLVLIAFSCILMGAGIPTTALYIMLVSVAQPALAQLGIPPIASHMFVLYYGVVAEITPPVCTSAYAASAIANSNPFRTGVSAFTLGLGKVVAPMAFVYAPVLLFADPNGFDLLTFAYSAVSAIFGVIALSAAVVGVWLAPLAVWARLVLALGGLVFIAPSFASDIIALLIITPVILQQVLARLSQPASV